MSAGEKKKTTVFVLLEIMFVFVLLIEHKMQNWLNINFSPAPLLHLSCRQQHLIIQYMMMIIDYLMIIMMMVMIISTCYYLQ